MATIINNRSSLATDPLRNFRFLVTFKEHKSYASGDASTFTDAHFGFTSVSGLAVTTDSIPYREGGYNTTVHQIPGQSTFAPITLQRGVMLGNTQNWDRMRKMFSTVQAGGTTLAPGKTFRFDLEIAVLNHPIPAAGADDVTATTTQTATLTSAGLQNQDQVAMRFHVYNCWPTSLAYSDLNAGDNALLVEQMTLVHEGFDVALGSFSAADGKFTDAAAF